MKYPKLRMLEAVPVSISGQAMIGLRDPLNFSTATVAIPQHFYLLLTLLDGKHSVVDIQAEYMSAGELIFREPLQDVIDQLDERLFLDNEKFRSRRDEITAEFRNSDVRPAMLAGKSYEASPEALAAQIDAFFTHEDGPGPIGSCDEGKDLKGIVAPHIDILRGGPCFAWAYKAVAEALNGCETGGPEVFVILGTAHAPTEQQFAMTRKGYDTPFGVMPCEVAMVDEILKACGDNLLADEFVHKNEHSIEFQAVFLRYLFRERDDVSIVPILCGSFQEIIASSKNPIDDERISGFIAALKNAVAGCGKKVRFIAGADLAHVGPNFGDQALMDVASLKTLEADDRKMLESVEALDADGFLENIMADGDRRRICGLSSIYTMLKAMDAGSGKLLKYQYFPDPNGTVSFAGMTFH